MSRIRCQMAATLMILSALAACAPQTALVGTTDAQDVQSNKPENADPDSCWAKQTTPAVIETVTRQVQVRPAQVGPDGAILSPAQYRTETVQDIVQERQDQWFETLCDDQLTPDFIASLQRALAIRGYYIWPVNGEIDRNTRAAIRQYQSTQGLNTATLSQATAQQLGLAVVDSPDRNN